MLAYYVEWHMRLKPMLFDDEDAESARRSFVVAPAQASASAKAGSKRNADGDLVHSFRTLIGDLATRNTVAPCLAGAKPFQITTRPTPIQKKALDLLGVKP